MTGHNADHGHRHLLHRHDAADSIDAALESDRRGIRAVKISFAALMVTAVAQLLIVVVTGSVALLATRSTTSRTR